jgi:O-6-methylguanine DNA methyltransferase
VRAVVKAIPRGRAMTYREVAAAAGFPRAARAVGQVMKANRDPLIPCHRVIRADGTPGGYNRGPAAKIRRLREEGVTTL